MGSASVDGISTGADILAALPGLIDPFELDEVQDAEHQHDGADCDERRMDHDVSLSPKKILCLSLACVAGLGEPKRHFRDKLR
jgi:hypothetical protein